MANAIFSDNSSNKKVFPKWEATEHHMDMVQDSSTVLDFAWDYSLEGRSEMSLEEDKKVIYGFLKKQRKTRGFFTAEIVSLLDMPSERVSKAIDELQLDNKIVWSLGWVVKRSKK